MVPLISNIGYGLLGACQLPRFWWKVTLRRADYSMRNILIAAVDLIHRSSKF